MRLLGWFQVSNTPWYFSDIYVTTTKILIFSLLQEHVFYLYSSSRCIDSLSSFARHSLKIKIPKCFCLMSWRDIHITCSVSEWFVVIQSYLPLVLFLNEQKCDYKCVGLFARKRTVVAFPIIKKSKVNKGWDICLLRWKSRFWTE